MKELFNFAFSCQTSHLGPSKQQQNASDAEQRHDCRCCSSAFALWLALTPKAWKGEFRVWICACIIGQDPLL